MAEQTWTCSKCFKSCSLDEADVWANGLVWCPHCGYMMIQLADKAEPTDARPSGEEKG